MRTLLTWFFHACFFMGLSAQVVLHEQVCFPEEIPAGGYSGITWLGDDRYAVVSDNSPHPGFFTFHIDIDSTGMIRSVKNLGFTGHTDPGRDQEGIAWFAPDSTLFISDETHNQVRELRLDATPTGRQLPLPKVFEGASRNYGMEALTYQSATHRFWTTSESTLLGDGPQTTATNGVRNRLRLLAFDDSLQLEGQYLYEMEEVHPLVPAQTFVCGVSALTALDDGRLLVLERDAAIPESKIGAMANCRIYMVRPTPCHRLREDVELVAQTPLSKTLVAEWTTSIGLLDFSFANYEGMCLGPKLPDGGQVILLVADSQNQYAGVLSDWFRTLVIY